MTRALAPRRCARRRRLIRLSLVLLLGGCGADPKPFDYHPANEIPPGPGLFTGKTGSYEIVVTRDEPGADAANESASPAPRQGSLPRPAEHPPYTTGATPLTGW